jgi:hypothetical protein
MGSSYNRLYTATCGYFTPVLASLALLIVLISLIDIIAIITLTCVNRKYYELKVGTQTTPANADQKK